jgi:hypothetical protein
MKGVPNLVAFLLKRSLQKRNQKKRAQSAKKKLNEYHNKKAYRMLPK